MAFGPWLCHVGGTVIPLKQSTVVAAELAKKACDECVLVAGHADLSSKGAEGFP